jgi:hypothetical protein
LISGWRRGRGPSPLDLYDCTIDQLSDTSSHRKELVRSLSATLFILRFHQQMVDRLPDPFLILGVGIVSQPQGRLRSLFEGPAMEEKLEIAHRVQSPTQTWDHLLVSSGYLFDRSIVALCQSAAERLQIGDPAETVL